LERLSSRNWWSEESRQVNYTKASTALEHILESMRIRLGPISETQDPLEGHREYTGASAVDGLPDFAAWDKVDEVAKRARVACFCRDGDLPSPDPCALDFAPPWAGWARDRMWAQYADGHAGVCLAFDRRKLVEAFDSALAGRGERLAKEVAYSDAPIPSVGPHSLAYDNRQIQQLGAEKYAAEYRRQHAPTLYLTKRLDYEGEREFRLVLLDDDTSGSSALVPIRSALVYVMLGDRFPRPYQPCVDAIMRREDLPVYRFKYESGRNVSAYRHLASRA
jgi:hypothetical protein